MHHHLHFVEKAFGEQRANGTVDQAAGEGFKLAGLGFALEKAAGDFACSIGFFKVIHRQGEKVLTRFSGFGTHYGGQHHGAVHIEQHCAARLACDFARFHFDGVLTPLESLGYFVKHCHHLLLFE